MMQISNRVRRELWRIFDEVLWVLWISVGILVFWFVVNLIRDTPATSFSMGVGLPEYPRYWDALIPPLWIFLSEVCSSVLRKGQPDDGNGGRAENWVYSVYLLTGVVAFISGIFPALLIALPLTLPLVLFAATWDWAGQRIIATCEYMIRTF